MLNWRLNVSTNCATFSGIALTVGRKSNIQFNQTNVLYTHSMEPDKEKALQLCCSILILSMSTPSLYAMDVAAAPKGLPSQRAARARRPGPRPRAGTHRC